MQYFVGLHEFHPEPLFDPSMMVHFRKRFPVEEVAKINEYVCTGRWPEEQRNVDRNDNSEDGDEPPCAGGGAGSKPSVQKGSANPNTSKKKKARRKKNRGKLILDATVAPRRHQASHRHRPAQQEPGAPGNSGGHSLAARTPHQP